MESLYLLIPIALIIIVLAIKLLFWAINSGQYDDLNTEGHRILFDEPVEKSNVPTEKKTASDISSVIPPENDQEAP
jgi:cbb3-type cytochrome oxidase maturation protein